MTNFEDLSVISGNLVQYFTGSYTILALMCSVIFLLVLLTREIDIKYAVAITMPLLGALVIVGWFGTLTNGQWIINLALVVVSVLYGVSMVKLTT